MIKNCKNCWNNMMTSSWRHFEFKKLNSSWLTIHQVSPQSNFWFGIHTALKSAPLKQYHVTHDDVIKLRLHIKVAYMREIMYNNCETIIINSATDISKCSTSVFWDVFNLPLEAALTFTFGDIIGIIFLNQTFARVV